MANATQVFEMMGNAVEELGPKLVEKVKGVIKFDVTNAGAWVIDLKNGKGGVTKANGNEKVDLIVTVRID